MTWLKNHLCYGGHYEKVRNIKAHEDYVQKETSRVEGPFYYPEPVCKEIKDPLAGKTLYKWQQWLQEKLSQEADERSILWVYDENGCKGKTSFAKHWCLKDRHALVVEGKSSDVAHALGDTPSVVFFCLPRAGKNRVNYSIMESVKDGLLFSGKYESKLKMFNCPHVVVFANYAPKIEEMSLDRWVIYKIEEDSSGSGDSRPHSPDPIN